MPPSEYAPPEIRNSMFMPLVKKGFSSPPLFCVICLRGRKPFRGNRIFFPSGAILPLPPLKMESVPDQKKILKVLFLKIFVIIIFFL